MTFSNEPVKVALQARGSGIGDGEPHHRGGQAGVIGVERNERRERLQVNRHVRGPVFHAPIGYSPRKRMSVNPSRSRALVLPSMVSSNSCSTGDCGDHRLGVMHRRSR